MLVCYTANPVSPATALCEDGRQGYVGMLCAPCGPPRKEWLAADRINMNGHV
jgi:hypothetical protein